MGMSARVSRIAVVNRGEAASRCFRAIRELTIEEGSGLVGIALYTDPDRLAPFVREADEALALGPAFQQNAAGETKSVYLDYDRIVAALRQVKADAVWPGWGFVAEHPEFADRLKAEGITFLGPSGDTMRRLGDKIMSKVIAEAAGVPVSPWSGGAVTRDSVEEWARKIGFPVVLKATAGGGGRGIRVVDRPEDLLPAFDSASTEAKNAFGDGTLFVEAKVTNARHVEVQMAADQHGGILAVGLRDCSAQRKHQKVVEEAPPPGLSAALMTRMKEASISLLRQVGYVGVATCEYLVHRDETFFFLEVNPRLQVEHGVTELLTGFDLVKTQIRIARGERLPAEVPEERGAAIEVRLCAEDPAAGFAPSPGHIALLDLPAGPGIRVDSGIGAGMAVPSEFDSMVAKVLAHGNSREEARARLVRAALDARVVIEGGMTNKGFLLDVLTHPDFVRGGIHTGWLDSAGLARPTPPVIEALLVAAIHIYQDGRAALRQNFFAEASRGRPMNVPESQGTDVDLVYAGRPYRLHVFALGGWAYRVHESGRAMQCTLREEGAFSRQLITRDRTVQVLVSSSDVEIRIEVDGRLHRVERDVGGRVRAPAPSLLIELAVKPGDRVAAGDRLGLFEAMKCETAFHAPLSGIVREVSARPGERLNAGDVIVVIEPSSEAPAPGSAATIVSLRDEPHPLDAFLDRSGRSSLAVADALPGAEKAQAVEALRMQIRRILLGYDVSEPRAAHLVATLSSPVDGLSAEFQTALGSLIPACLEIVADIEILFSRNPSQNGGEELGPSNDARMSMYLRRIAAQGAGIDPGFLGLLRRALGHYNIRTLEPSGRLERSMLRLYSTRTTMGLRTRLATALMHLAMRLGVDHVEATTDLRDALDRLWMLRGTVKPTVSDLAAQLRFVLFDKKRSIDSIPPSKRVDLEATMVPPPADVDLAPFADPLGLTLDQVRRFEVWRLARFELERIEIPGFDGILALFGKSKEGRGDDRLFVFAEVVDLGKGAPSKPDLSMFEQHFHAAVEAMRSIQGQREDAQRLHWNRLYLFIRPPVLLSERLVAGTLRRLSPETGHIGLERVIVRIARVDAAGGRAQKIEVLAGNPTGGRVEWSVREPHDRPLEPAGPYERRVALARSRGLTYPYEIVRLFTAPAESRGAGIGQPTGRGTFAEYDLVEGRAVPVHREPGRNTAAVVFGVISTPTRKHPEGMRRVLVLSDPTMDMGALSAGECDRIVAAIDLAERDGVPVEWVAVSSGARIAMDSGTENLDSTARVVRRLVTFTDRGGEVNLILPGVNVGAQSYFDALATMGLSTRGILVMLPTASMVLTGRAALQFSGGVAAEDEVGIGGYERIMGPNGEAQYHARDLSDAYGILLEHYAVAYQAPGESGPRRLDTKDPPDRDVTLTPYEGPEAFKTVGDLFSPVENPGRKRPFSMRSLMKAVIDTDAGFLERWRDWADAATAIVWDTHVCGHPATVVGIESHQTARIGYTPTDGPSAWTAGTLFPPSSKKVARAINAASGNRPVVLLANLSGFDGSPESMRRGVLEMGAEIARAVVRFQGKIAFVVVTRYHGGAYVVFSHELNDQMKVAALHGSYASVIGGAAAAAVVFGRDVRKRAAADERVKAARAELEAARDPASRAAKRSQLNRALEEVTLEKQGVVAAEFDAVHSVERAREVGSLHVIL
ncbi:MAG TPA: carboxyl transferase domain-containing protein, partial [Polyangiaceae bacterium]|nr:carboxyl transferase domain-containing protein [Polyangiaceae bacterium]